MNFPTLAIFPGCFFHCLGNGSIAKNRPQTHNHPIKIVLLSVLLALTAQADEFAFKLYDPLRETKGNLFFSPASIETALAITREGARGQTLAQLSLCLENPTPVFHPLKTV